MGLFLGILVHVSIPLLILFLNPNRSGFADFFHFGAPPPPPGRRVCRFFFPFDVPFLLSDLFCPPRLYFAIFGGWCCDNLFASGGFLGYTINNRMRSTRNDFLN